MKKKSKLYLECAKKIDHLKIYELNEAVDLLKSLKKPKFDESVEIALKLGIDPKRSEQLIRGAISLPNGIGKELKIIVFATGENVKVAKDSGAIEAGGEDLIKKIQGGWLDFDVAIATPDLMKEVGKLGKILGPQGKMPTPKTGTVTNEIKKTVKEYKAGKIEFKTDPGGNVHALMGKISFPTQHLVENINSFIKHIINLKPSSVKGTFVEKAIISSTMSPGISLAI